MAADDKETRRISTTPIPPPQLPFAKPTPSPLSEKPASPDPGAQAVAPAPAPAPAPATTADAKEAPKDPGPAPAAAPTPSADSESKDVAMRDAHHDPEHAASPAPLPAAVKDASPAPGARTSTPSRTNGEKESSSRAASQHPDTAFTVPTEAPPHGAPVRQYLNTKVTGTLLEGMKLIAKDRPKDPLRVLGEFLIKRSKEAENSA